MEIKNGRMVVETIETYHANPALSGSGIKALLKSPYHYKTEYIERKWQKHTPAMDFGTLVHTAILEPEKFFTHVSVEPVADKRTKAGKTAIKEFEETLSPSSIRVSAKDMDRIAHAVKSIQSNPEAAFLIGGGIAEHSFYFTHPNGIEAKVRPDYIRENLIILDLKTTKDARLDPFTNQAYNLEYHIQAAWNLDAMKHIYGREFKAMVFICVETAPPYPPACVYPVGLGQLERGRRDYLHAMDVYKQAMKLDKWPGYQYDISTMEMKAQNMDLPPWALYKEEQFEADELHP